MSKLDELRRLAGGNVDDSMGVGRPAGRPVDVAVHGAQQAPARWQGVIKSKTAAEIPVDRIGADPDQPREEFEPAALGRLAESMKARGQLQPIRVRWDEGRGSYVVIAGERRWRAAQMAGLATVSCVVDDRPIAPGELLAIQLVENALREDLKPIESARAFRTLMAANGWTVSQVARELAIDHSNVSRALALLDLPAAVQERVEGGALAPSVAYEISKAPDAETQAEVADLAIAGGLSRAEVVEAVRKRTTGSKSAAKGRGGSKPPLPSTLKFRTAAGVRITAERTKGLDPGVVLEALRELVTRFEAEVAGQGAEAA